jgi:hypothetical protein
MPWWDATGKNKQKKSNGSGNVFYLPPKLTSLMKSHHAWKLSILEVLSLFLVTSCAVHRSARSDKNKAVFTAPTPEMVDVSHGPGIPFGGIGRFPDRHTIFSQEFHDKVVCHGRQMPGPVLVAHTDHKLSG